jgi:hypothetical protein
LLVYVGNDVTSNNDWFGVRATGGIKQKDLLHKVTYFLNDHSRLYYLTSGTIKRWLFIIRSAKWNGQDMGSDVVNEEDLAYSMEAHQKTSGPVSSERH